MNVNQQRSPYMHKWQNLSNKLHWVLICFSCIAPVIQICWCWVSCHSWITWLCLPTALIVFGNRKCWPKSGLGHWHRYLSYLQNIVQCSFSGEHKSFLLSNKYAWLCSAKYIICRLECHVGGSDSFWTLAETRQAHETRPWVKVRLVSENLTVLTKLTLLVDFPGTLLVMLTCIPRPLQLISKLINPETNNYFKGYSNSSICFWWETWSILIQHVPILTNHSS